MKFRINFLSEAPWSLFKISDLEAKIWKSASDVKLWNFVFFWNSSLSQSKTSPRRWECPKSTREMCFLYFSHFLSFGYFTSKFNILRCSTEEIDLGFWENIDISKFLCYPVTKHPQCTGLVGVTFDETHFQFQTLVRKYLHGIWKNNLKFTHFEGKWWSKMVWKSGFQRIRLRFYCFILVYGYQRMIVPIYIEICHSYHFRENFQSRVLILFSLNSGPSFSSKIR